MATTMRCCWYEQVDAEGHDAVTSLFEQRRHDGVLSVEHPASSRGLPVYVEDGVPRGPADLPRATHLHYDRADEDLGMIRAAQLAGYRIEVDREDERIDEADSVSERI